MKWQLLEPHHIDEQVLGPGTIIGDDTQWPYRAAKEDRKIGREIPETDPTKSIPLTGAEGSPKVAGPGQRPPPFKPETVNPAPEQAPQTGIEAPTPKSTPAPAA